MFNHQGLSPGKPKAHKYNPEYSGLCLTVQVEKYNPNEVHSDKGYLMRKTQLSVEEIAALAPKTLGPYIDHTLLKPDAAESDIERLCREAVTHQFFGVCVNSLWLKFIVKLLDKTPVAKVAVVGFPLGSVAIDVLEYETNWCANHGANEIDMVLPVGFLKAGMSVGSTIEKVVRAAGPKIGVKVILETCLLNDDQKKKACREAAVAGAQYVKTSTGFSTGGATLDDVRLMRAEVGQKLGVKASGGVKTWKDALEMLKAGATRIGTSSGVAIATSLDLGSSGGY